MRRAVTVAGLVCVMAFGAAYGHHAAEGIVDAEVYEMIEALVEDTPHALIDINDLGGGMMEIAIQAPTVRSMENMIDDGLLTYFAMLDGQVTLTMEFLPRGGMAMEVEQRK
jgi:hypothetical protein